MNIATLTPKQLRTAADLQEKIAGLKSELAAIFGSESEAAPAPKAAKPAKRKLSASHLAKIRAAQKLRWSKFNAAKAKTVPVKAAVKASAKPVKKGGMSAAGRARIVAAQKARWAAIKAAKTAPKAPVKPAAVVKAAVKPAAKAVKRVISPEARAKMAAAAKAMWAAKKAAKK